MSSLLVDYFMGTDNPKVSAYVPQAIKDRLKQFREEHNLSESQAVTTILAEYFGMTQALGRSPEGLTAEGVTLARMEALEEKLANLVVPLSSIPSELLEKIDQFTLAVRLLEAQFEVIEQKVIEQGSLLSRLKGEPKEADLLVTAQEVEEVVSQPELDLEDSQFIEEDAGNRQLELIEPALSNLPSEPLEEISLIPGIKLSKLRFGLSESRVSAMRQKILKQEMSLEEFTQWTKDKDRDGIPWKYVESQSKGYVPAEELSSEQKSSLLKWIEENIHKAD